MITFRNLGNFKNTRDFLLRNKKLEYKTILDLYGKKGVEALKAATPVDSGETSLSWGYKIVELKDSFKIIWTNSNVNNGEIIAILIQYGHGTRNGGWVQGRNYINPAVKPVFDKIVNDIWREVTKS